MRGLLKNRVAVTNSIASNPTSGVYNSTLQKKETHIFFPVSCHMYRKTAEVKEDAIHKNNGNSFMSDDGIGITSLFTTFRTAILIIFEEMTIEP